jgi:hypothetical protein
MQAITSMMLVQILGTLRGVLDPPFGIVIQQVEVYDRLTGSTLPRYLVRVVTDERELPTYRITDVLPEQGVGLILAIRGVLRGDTPLQEMVDYVDANLRRLCGARLEFHDGVLRIPARCR